MKVSLLQENLSQAVNRVSRVVASKAQLPVLGNILLTTEKGRLRLSATNLETGMSIWLGAKVEKEGRFTVPARVLGELVGSLPKDTVELELKQDELKIKCGRFKAKVNGMAADEFPKMPSLRGSKKREGEERFEIKGGVLAEAVEQVGFAAATDETRPVFTGVKLELMGKDLRMAATDGYRLSIKQVAGLGIKNNKYLDKGLVVPARALMEAAKMIEGEEKQVEVAVTDKGSQMILGFDEVEVISRLIEGEFPDFEKIVPETSTTTAELEREELVGAVKAAAIFARDSANIVKMQIKSKGLVISANAPQVGENEVGLEAKITGEENEIAFNCRYLLEMLGAVKTERLRFEMTGALNPGMFRIPGDKSFQHVIMPVRVQG